VNERDTREQLQDILGHEVVDSAGETIGYVDVLFLDDATARPELIGVWNGVWGTKPRVLVPLEGVERIDDRLRVPWAKEVVESGPTYDEEDETGVLVDHTGSITITPEKEREVLSRYGIAALAGTQFRPRRTTVAGSP
jgi:sporulation protein YlmC with PRC-barrel domain